MTSSPARILIVDDHPMIRAGLSAQISGEPGLTVCGEADDVLSPQELQHVALLGITTVGWPSAIAAFSWIRDELERLA